MAGKELHESASIFILYSRFIYLVGVYLFYTIVSVSAVQKSESAIWIYIAPLSGFPSHLGHRRALSRVPSAVQQVLVSYLLYT